MATSFTSPFELPGFEMDGMTIEDTTLHISAHSTTQVSNCPDCNEPSDNVHSYYLRHPQDLPCSGLGVRWHLTIKRFRCHNTDCTRKTFVERIPAVIPVFGRRLARLTEVLYRIGLGGGGEAAARVGQSFQIQVSGDTILRIIGSAVRFMS